MMHSESATLEPTLVPANTSDPKPVKKADRQFDFKLYTQRHIALKVAYLGWDYHGLAIQETADDTIESKLFEALKRAKLIESHLECKFARCGRTDKGVSALSQVVSLYVRSNLLEGVGVVSNADCRASERKGDKTTEILYMHILNKLLPEDIRVLAWAPVTADFSARFSCLQRTYKYIFPRGNLDISRMQCAAQKFVGEHDLGTSVSPSSPYQMHEVTITGLAFLWHQVRCMVGVLFLIGSGLEDVMLVDQMLDIEKCPRKPQYGMASEAHEYLVSHFQALWTAQMVRATMLRRMLDSLEYSFLTGMGTPTLPSSQLAPLVTDQKSKSKSYKPMMSRQTSGSSTSLDELIDYHQSKRRRLEEED
eukprot:Em0008g1166a